VRDIVGEDGRVSAVELSDGTRVEADVVLVAIGSKPAVDWLEGSSVPLGRRGADPVDGVLCDGRGRALPAVYAAGDVAAWWDARVGFRHRVEHRLTAAEQGRIVAQAIVRPDQSAPEPPVPYFWSDQYDLQLQVYGLPGEKHDFAVVEGDLTSGRYIAVYGRDGVLSAVLGWRHAASAPRLATGRRRDPSLAGNTRRYQRMTTIDEESAPAFPVARTCPYATPELYEGFREEGGLHRVTIWNGDRPYLATRYDDVRATLAEESLSADVLTEDFPLTSAFQPHHEGGIFLRTDNPEHDRIRRMLTREFTVKNAFGKKAEIEELVDELLDAILAEQGPVDLISRFTSPIPGVMISKIIGVPEEDREHFTKLVVPIADLSATMEEKLAAGQEMGEFFTGLVRAKHEQPGDDLTSRVIREFVDTGALTDAELSRILGVLFGAGQETTANMLGLCILALLEHPEQLAKLRDGIRVNRVVPGHLAAARRAGQPRARRPRQRRVGRGDPRGDPADAALRGIPGARHCPVRHRTDPGPVRS